jgi:hypothetical protein
MHACMILRIATCTTCMHYPIAYTYSTIQYTGQCEHTCMHAYTTTTNAVATTMTMTA